MSISYYLFISKKLVDYAGGGYGGLRTGQMDDDWTKGCRCGKIKCLKLYCICFRNNMLCNSACVRIPALFFVNSYLYVCACDQVDK